MALDQPLAAARIWIMLLRLWVEPLAGLWSNKSALLVSFQSVEAEYALHELRDAGFNMNNVSVVAKDADRGDEIAGVDMSSRVGKADAGRRYNRCGDWWCGRRSNRFISRSWRFSYSW